MVALSLPPCSIKSSSSNRALIIARRVPRPIRPSHRTPPVTGRTGKQPVRGRTGQQHHRNGRRRTDPLTLKQRRKAGEFDAGNDDDDDGDRQERPPRERPSGSASSYFSSPSARSAAASAAAFSEACYIASLTLAAASPSAFSKKDHGSRLKRSFFDGYSSGRSSDQSGVGRGRVAGEKKCVGGVTVNESASSRPVQTEGKAAGERALSMTRIRSYSAPSLFMERKLKRRPVPQQVTPDASSASAAAQAGAGGGWHRSPAIPPARAGLSLDAAFLPDRLAPPAADKKVMAGGSTRNNTSHSRRSKSSRRSPWRSMFLCWADCGNASYDAVSGGNAVTSRAMSAVVKSGRGSINSGSSSGSRSGGSSGSNKSRGSKSAGRDLSPEIPPFQPKMARGHFAGGTSVSSASGSGVRVGGDEEQSPLTPQARNPPYPFPLRPVSSVTECFTSCLTAPATSAVSLLSKPIRDPLAVLTSAGSTVGGGVRVGGDEEHPPAGPQTKNPASRFLPCLEASVTESWCASARMSAAAGVALRSKPTRDPPAVLTSAGPTNGGDVGAGSDEKQPPAGHQSRNPASRFPHRQASSVTESSYASTADMAGVAFQPNEIRSSPAVLTSSSSTSGGGVRVGGDEKQPLAGPQTKNPASRFLPRSESSITESWGASARTPPAAAVASTPLSS